MFRLVYADFTDNIKPDSPIKVEKAWTQFLGSSLSPNSLITPDVTAATLVEGTIAKKSFVNLTLLLCKT